jgi:anaerobic ribonucleoside-triphosphate reductase activating protein
MSVDEVVGQLLDTGLPVTVLGGEPFDQAPAVAQIVQACHVAGRHVIVYTGNLFEDLVRRARKEPAIQRILAHADVLVDGPFVADQDHDRLQYRGSANQRPIDLDIWRETGDTVLLDWDTSVDVAILPDGSILVPEGYAIDLEALFGCASIPARRCGEGVV